VTIKCSDDDAPAEPLATGARSESGSMWRGVKPELVAAG
jgi:hypothetical protein